MRYAVLAGRQLFSIIFIIASARHFSPEVIESAARHSVPIPEVLVPLSGMIALVGGLSVLLGFQTRIGAGLLVIFLVPVTVMMHNFWASTDPVTHQIEQAMFLKNITMLGGALIISYFGAGPLSLDGQLNRDRGVINHMKPSDAEIRGGHCANTPTVCASPGPKKSEAATESVNGVLAAETMILNQQNHVSRVPAQYDKL